MGIVKVSKNWYLILSFKIYRKGVKGDSSENKTTLRSQNSGDRSQNGEELRIRMYHAKSQSHTF